MLEPAAGQSDNRGAAGQAGRAGPAGAPHPRPRRLDLAQPPLPLPLAHSHQGYRAEQFMRTSFNIPSLAFLLQRPGVEQAEFPEQCGVRGAGEQPGGLALLHLSPPRVHHREHRETRFRSCTGIHI